MTGDTFVQFTFYLLHQANHQHRCLLMLLISNHQWCTGLHVQSFVADFIETMCGFTVRRVEDVAVRGTRGGANGSIAAPKCPQ